jgi:hypothetical protein
MAAAVQVRGDYHAARLRELAKRSADAAQPRHLLALAAIYAGGSRSEAATIGGVGRQTVRDWVLAFNAAGPSGLINGKVLGKRLRSAACGTSPSRVCGPRPGLVGPAARPIRAHVIACGRHPRPFQPSRRYRTEACDWACS